MFKIGDKIKIGPLQGEITEVYQKTQIGFKPKTEVSYDIMLKEVPEKKIQTVKPKEDGTD